MKAFSALLNYMTPLAACSRQGRDEQKGKPRTRWEDELNEFLSTQRRAEKGDWRLLAACREEWQKEEAAYRKACAEEDEQEEEEESW